MSKKKRKNIGWTLSQLIVKITVMIVTIAIGLWCGWSDEYNGFYLAVLVQAVNNMYDASAFFKGYTKFVTIFQVISFFTALCSAVLSIIHFTPRGSIVDSIPIVIGACGALSFPLLHFGIELYSMIRDERF